MTRAASIRRTKRGACKEHRRIGIQQTCFVSPLRGRFPFWHFWGFHSLGLHWMGLGIPAASFFSLFFRHEMVFGVGAYWKVDDRNSIFSFFLSFSLDFSSETAEIDTLNVTAHGLMILIFLPERT